MIMKQSFGASETAV